MKCDDCGLHHEEGDCPPVYSREGTSHAAGESVQSVRPSLREMAFMCIQDSGRHGRTDEELADEMGLELNTARPRRWELEHADRITDSGQRRRGRSGRMAIVWIVTPIEPVQLELVATRG